MAIKVTIEGSRITPTDKLPAGVRTTVLLTPETQEFINRGFGVVISREQLPDDEPVESSGDSAGDDSGSGSEPDGNLDVDPDKDDDPDPTPDTTPEPDPEPQPEPVEKPSRGRRPKAAETPEE